MSDESPERFARLAHVLVDASPDALIAMSAAGEIFFWSHGIEAGCDSDITKPIDTRTLAAMIAAHLERAAR